MLIAGCGRPAEEAGVEPLRVLGRMGYGPREFSYPRAIAIDHRDHAYIVDKTGRIQAFDAVGEWITSWRTPMIDAGKPTGLGVDRVGNVFVADTHYSRVLVYSPSGELLREFGGFGDEAGRFRLPTDVEVGADGDLFVGEYGGNDRITHFSAAGEVDESFGAAQLAAAPLQRPQGIHIDRADSQVLWVSDSRNHRICKFSSDGRLLASFGRMGRDRGELRFPYGIDQLSDGSLVVAEYGNNRVQRFAQDGESRGCWGRGGREVGELAYPWAVAVDSRDQVWVVDSGNNRVQIIDGRSAATWR